MFEVIALNKNDEAVMVMGARYFKKDAECDANDLNDVIQERGPAGISYDEMKEVFSNVCTYIDNNNTLPIVKAAARETGI